MKNSFKRKIGVTILSAIMVSMCLPGLAANPGSNDDPLVSLSYVNDVLMPQVRSYVDSKLGESGEGFELVNVKKGQTIIGAQSTQFILRMGSATVVATEKGGLSDVTAGTDLAMGTQMPANHLLIVPFEDWRGVTMQTDGILLIKGIYSLH